jgi:hypothetical protein
MSRNNETEFEKAVREGKLVHPEKILQHHIVKFNQAGGETPVKVMPTGMDQQEVSGFFTQAKFILGRTPQQMEHDLGLKPGDLKNGATIYELSQTPNAEQFVPAGYTHMPGGSFYQDGSEYPVGAGAIQFRLDEALPAKVIGKVGYEEAWKGPSAEQGVDSSTLSPDSTKTLSNEEISEAAGEITGNAAAGPVGGVVGKVVGETTGEAQKGAMESIGQSTENPVKANENAEQESTSDAEQNYGYGYGY